MRDKDVEQKRQAISNTLKFQKQVLAMQPNAVFASIVDRKPYDQLSSEETAMLTARSSESGSSAVKTSNPFKAPPTKTKHKVSNLMFGSRDDSVELMMATNSSHISSSRKKGSEVVINEQSSGVLE